METLTELLARSAARHHKLLPAPGIGGAHGHAGRKGIGSHLPQADKRLFTFVECDGCGMGGIAVASGCFPERRTMRVMDYGKLAATFVDTQTGRSDPDLPPSRGARPGSGAFSRIHSLAKPS